MVQRCHALRKVPIARLSSGDCRLLIGQDIGTKHLVPLALNFLEEKPLVEGDYYPGDLLLALFRLPVNYWAGSFQAFQRLLAVAKRASGELTSIEEPLGSEQKLLKEVNAFLQQNDA